MTQIEFHPIANVFPLIDGQEFADLAADIRKHGLREPIMLHGDGRVLDGRNRYRACVEAGVDARFETYHGADAVAFVVSLNLRRRHLSESQRAMVAAKIANLDRGGDRKSDQTANLQFDPSEPSITSRHAADMLNVSERTVNTARSVREHAVPELIAKVESGVVSVSAAADVARLPEPEQQVIVAKGEKEILEAAKRIRSERAEARRAENDDLKAASLADMPDGKYNTIVIDPPWDMQKIERDVRPNQVAFDYPTMTEEELASFGVPGMANDDCHIFCWTTQKFLPSALRLMEAWGFRYVLAMVWHKAGGFQPIGLPQYNCEFVVYGRRGSPQFLETKAFPCCFHAERREHSRKPDEFYDLIRRVAPEPRIDVFSREKRVGFDQFGNEAGKFQGAA